MSSRSTTKVTPPTTKTTLALIPYLNCEPFHSGLNELGFDIVHEVPSDLGRLAETNVATCGPMPVVDYFRLRDRYDPLGDFGIASEGPAHSVLFFARKQIGDLAGERIGVTTESSTSVLLLRLLLGQRYGLDGLSFTRGESAEDVGRLLIGDTALRAASDGLDDFPFVYDLGEEWLAWQALPFVFARWVVSKDVPAEERTLIQGTIAASLDSWEERVGEITARRGADLGLDEESVQRYLETFRYRIGPVEALGEQTFESLLKEHD